MIKKLRHIGIVVDNFERAVDKFKGFGLECTELLELKEIGVRIAFFPIGDTLIEILYYTGDDKGHDTVVRSQKGAINHLCFEVDDLEATIQHFENIGARLAKGFPRAGAHGRVAFFYPEDTEGVLIEICQV
jgi:methylmalonyl-CoA/ethylmalonyl-CoA epimerase